MITDKLKQLETLRARATALEQQIAAVRAKELSGLPAKYGFGSMNEFIAALRAGGTGGKRRGRPPGTKKAAAAKSGRRRRATITDDMRAEVKKLAGQGKTGAAIAKSVGISLPSVQNIKKALGLVRKKR